jgi:hypothetical protein
MHPNHLLTQHKVHIERFRSGYRDSTQCALLQSWVLGSDGFLLGERVRLQFGRRCFRCSAKHLVSTDKTAGKIFLESTHAAAS